MSPLSNTVSVGRPTGVDFGIRCRCGRVAEFHLSITGQPDQYVCGLDLTEVLDQALTSLDPIRRWVHYPDGLADHSTPEP